jgi:two-component system, OmpR family, response regulator AdeR
MHNKKNKISIELTDYSILMVEDDPFLRELYQRIFQRSGIEIVFAEDGEEGLSMIKAMKPDIVLLDVMLPIITGMELLAKMNTDLAKMPYVVMLSDLDQPGVREKAMELGACEFVSKNEVSGPELIRRVKEIVENSINKKK